MKKGEGLILLLLIFCLFHFFYQDKLWIFVDSFIFQAQKFFLDLFEEKGPCHIPQSSVPLYHLGKRYPIPISATSSGCGCGQKEPSLTPPSPSPNIILNCGSSPEKKCGCQSSGEKSCHSCRKEFPEKICNDDERSVIWGPWKYVVGCLPGQIDQYHIRCGQVDLSSREIISHSYGKIISIRVHGENHLLLIDNRSNEISAKINPSDGKLSF